MVLPPAQYKCSVFAGHSAKTMMSGPDIHVMVALPHACRSSVYAPTITAQTIAAILGETAVADALHDKRPDINHYSVEYLLGKDAGSLPQPHSVSE